MKPWFSTRRWRSNWWHAWTIGRLEFSIEWVPKARYYAFDLTIHSPENQS